MITSNGNQYLPPDYFNVPTTLDSKKSPLALLAQTCSQIGTDTPSGKNVPSLDRINKRCDSNQDKYSPSSSSSSRSSITPKPMTYRGYDSSSTAVDDKKGITSRMKLYGNKAASTFSKRYAELACKKDGACNGSKDTQSPKSSPGGRPGKFQEISDPRSQSTPLMSSPVGNKNGDASCLKLPPTSVATYLDTAYPQLDAMTSSLLHNPLKAALNPYLSYSRLKSMNDVAASPFCRDPYCTTCQINSHLLASAAAAQNGKSCPASCSQCNEVKSPAGLFSAAHTSAMAAVYAQAQLAALAAAASQLPYVCSWVGGDSTYCGKRFLTSDELLHHLRSHTSDPPLQTFPRPHVSSASNPLSASRYHPYAKSPLLPPSLLPLQGNSPAFSPALSPYFLYGSKITSSNLP